MAQSPNQKLKLVYLLKILEEHTDSEKGLTMSEIISYLEKYGVSAERKSIYNDFEFLRNAGYDVVMVKKDRNSYYRLNSRLFELPELKLLVDVIATSKLITQKQSEELINKIEKLGSRRQAGELQRSVFIYDRPKSKNEDVFENIGIITEALKEKKLIDFDYYQWSKDKKLVLRKNGYKKGIGPKFLEFVDGNYYLVAFDTEAGKVKHYRVDKMRKIRVTDVDYIEDKNSKIDQPKYSAQMSNMYSGETKEVRLEVSEESIGLLIDRFGSPAVKIIPIPTAEGKYTCRIDLQVSNQLFGWLLGVSDSVKLVGPDEVVDQYQSLLKQNLSSKSSAI